MYKFVEFRNYTLQPNITGISFSKEFLDLQQDRWHSYYTKQVINTKGQFNIKPETMIALISRGVIYIINLLNKLKDI